MASTTSHELLSELRQHDSARDHERATAVQILTDASLNMEIAQQMLSRICANRVAPPTDNVGGSHVASPADKEPAGGELLQISNRLSSQVDQLMVAMGALTQALANQRSHT